MGMCAELFHSASGHLERSRAGGDLHYSAVQAHSQALTSTFKEITVLPHGLFREKALIRCRTGAYAFSPRRLTAVFASVQFVPIFILIKISA